MARRGKYGRFCQLLFSPGYLRSDLTGKVMGSLKAIVAGICNDDYLDRREQEVAYDHVYPAIKEPLRNPVKLIVNRKKEIFARKYDQNYDKEVIECHYQERENDV